MAKQKDQLPTSYGRRRWLSLGHLQRLEDMPYGGGDDEIYVRPPYLMQGFAGYAHRQV